ncbi:MAG: TauD/TfdA dioxygenase family protein [Burkholderiales bacterium]
MIMIRRLGPAFGAEVSGVDLSAELDEDTFRAIERAYVEHSVLLFRGQRMSDERHVQFSRRFGELEVHVLREYVHPDHPELYRISNIIENGKRLGIPDAGNYWHTDLSYTAMPSRGSIMQSHKVPQRDGKALGDTSFCSTAAAYDALPESLKRRIDGLKAVHRFWDRYLAERKKAGQQVEVSAERRAQTPDVVHPVVKTHPLSGRKCLFVNEGFTISVLGLPEDESRELLQELYSYCGRPDNVYRHSWQVGDVVMWDNWATQHRLNVDYRPDEPRFMQRTTLVGSTAF